MATLYGAWMGTGYQARIRLDYGIAYSADHTQAIYNGEFSIEFGASVSDSVNSWSRSGDCGAASGSNVSYNTSGGRVRFGSAWSGVQKYGDFSASAQVSGVEAVGGGSISGSFTVDSGPLAPYFTDGTYGASNITSTSALISGFAGNGNGGTLNNVQVEYNTSPSDTGALFYTKGNYAAPTLSGLTPNTTYYARIRFANSTYGWGAWGGWCNFKTLSTIPSAPSEAWYESSSSQTTAILAGISVPYDGGAAIDQILVKVNTTPSLTGATDVAAAGSPSTVTIPNLLPGSTYYACVMAHNANGYSPATTWKAITTLPGVYVNVAGVWKEAVPYVNVDGVWKPASRYINVGGVWKQ